MMVCVDTTLTTGARARCVPEAAVGAFAHSDERTQVCTLKAGVKVQVVQLYDNPSEGLNASHNDGVEALPAAAPPRTVWPPRGVVARSRVASGVEARPEQLRVRLGVPQRALPRLVQRRHRLPHRLAPRPPHARARRLRVAQRAHVGG